MAQPKTTPLDWTRVAEAVAARRGQLGMRTQEEAATRAQVGVTTWRQIEGAKQGRYRPTILAAIATALEWRPDAIQRIAAGEDPADMVSISELVTRQEVLERKFDEMQDQIREIARRLPPPAPEAF